MGFFSRLVQFIFWVLIFSWAVKLVARMLGGASRKGATPGADRAADGDSALPGKRLVRDPVCGMHMAEELALPMSANGETQYFCSMECREKYEQSVLRRTANG
jgi:YHS domain-containing protein